MSRSAAKSRGDRYRVGSAPPPPPPPPSEADAVDIVPGRLAESAWVAMTTQEDGEEAVAEIVADLTSAILDACHERDVEKQLIPYTAFWACGSLVETVNWLFLARDEGEMAESAPLWGEDSEPLSSPYDSWSEGCVPVYSSWVSSHTLLLQKLLDFNSVEATDLWDSQSKSRSPMREDLDKTEAPAPTMPPGTADPATTVESDPEKPPVRTASSKPTQARTRRFQLQPASPRQASPPPHGGRRPLQHAPGNGTGKPGISKDNLPTYVTQPPQCRRTTVPLYKKLDLARLPVSYNCPEVEVLEPCPSQQRNKGLSARPQPDQKHRNTDTSASTSPCIHPQGLPSIHRRSVIRKPQRSILHAQRNGFTPPFPGLALDKMELRPGVSFGEPSVGKSGPGREDPAWLLQMPEQRPIRRSPRPLLWSLDEVVTGPSPRVTPPTSRRTSWNTAPPAARSSTEVQNMN